MNKRYRIEKSLGRGGMGEVFLAYDTEAKRHVALKQIRDDLAEKPAIKKRFLREAKISSILSHPSIVPIYDIYLEEPYFYTMPFVEGRTLKEIIKTTKLFEPSHPIGSSIPTLIRIFLNVCEAIAYIHSKNILHRDLKPDNIIIGKYGEVLILDWGIAKFLNEKEIEEDVDISIEELELTKPGKVAGTVSYMPPERALGKRADESCDTYALGIILYQILCLEVPFKRKDLQTFRKNYRLEKISPPIEKAPFRDIPKKLSNICMKCLEENQENRYQSAEDLISDLTNYIEGRPDWVLSANLDLKNSDDWQFQENILLAEHFAISPKTDFAKWVTLMVTKLAFSNNIKIEADFSLGKWSNGICFLLNILKTKNSFKLEEGYKLWLNLKKKVSEFSRSNVLIFKEKIKIDPDIFHKLIIEKIDDKLSIFLDNNLIFSHINHLPMRGNVFALAYKDTSFVIKNLKIYTSSYNVMVNCLTIGDAFFAREDYDTAIKEYQKIAFSFPGRKEAQEACFRSGISYLEKAKTLLKSKIKEKFLDLSLEEFEKLHSTPSEPLEYLGKSLVYLEKEDFIEEAKCLELMIRKFRNHYQSPIIKEYIIYRMHQSSLQNREGAYRIILIALRFLSDMLQNVDSKNILESLQKHLEPLYFFEKSTNLIQFLSIKLAFMLNKTSSILEILTTQKLDDINIENAIFCLLELNEIEKAELYLEKNKEKLKENSYKILKLVFQPSTDVTLDKILQSQAKKASFKNLRVLIYIFERMLEEKKSSAIIQTFHKIKKTAFTKEHKILLDSILIRSYLLENNFDLAAKIFERYKPEQINDENSPLHFTYGLWLYKMEGKEIANTFFSGILDHPHPFSFAISSHFIMNKRKDLLNKAFNHEKRRLLKDLLLYSITLKNKQILKQIQKISIS